MISWGWAGSLRGSCGLSVPRRNCTSTDVLAPQRFRSCLDEDKPKAFAIWMAASTQIPREVTPLFRRVVDVRDFIVNQQPVNTERVSLELCVVRARERENCWLLDLVDGGTEMEPGAIEYIKNCYNELEDDMQAKFAFRLAVWKSAIPISIVTRFREGVSYRFDYVYALHIYKARPLGSCRIWQRLGGGELRAPFDSLRKSCCEQLSTSVAADSATVGISEASCLKGSFKEVRRVAEEEAATATKSQN